VSDEAVRKYMTDPGRPPWVGEPQDSLVPLARGGVYRLRSRNLPFGVYDSDQPAGGGFIGIREKFGTRFLDTEYDRHTAQALEFLGMLPDRIKVRDREPGSFCRDCRKPARIVRHADLDAYPPVGIRYECDSGCDDVRTIAGEENKALFDYLDKLK